jgi:hypothetical protein
MRKENPMSLAQLFLEAGKATKSIGAQGVYAVAEARAREKEKCAELDVKWTGFEEASFDLMKLVAQGVYRFGHSTEQVGKDLDKLHL